MGSNSYSKVGSASDSVLMNPEDSARHQTSLAQLQGMQQNYNNLLQQLSGSQMQGLLQGIRDASGGYGAVGQGITDASNAFKNIDTSAYQAAVNAYDPQAANNALLAQMPGYVNAAQSAAAQSLSASGQSARDLAQLSTRDAMRASANELAKSGILYSGAGNQAMMEAALTPQQQLQTDLANMQSQYSGNVLNQLMGSGAAMLGQGYETQNQNALSAASQDIQQQQLAAQAGLQGATSQLDVLNSNVGAQQQLYNAYLQQLMSKLGIIQGQSGDLANLANLTQQQWWTPQYQKNPGMLDYINALAGGASAGASLYTAATSDKHLKHSIEPRGIEALEEVAEKLTGVSFEYNEGVDPAGDGKKRFGILAQDLQETFMRDNVIDTDAGKVVNIGQQTLSNTGLIAILAKELLALKKELAALKEKDKSKDVSTETPNEPSTEPTNESDKTEKGA